MAENEEKLPIISVKGAGTDGKVVLWERNEQHPPTLDKDGNDTGKPREAFVSNDGKVRQVAETDEVRRLIAENQLVKAGSSERKLETADEPRKPGRPPGS